MEIIKKRFVTTLASTLTTLILITVFISSASTMVLAQTDNITDNITHNTSDNTSDNITGKSTGRGEKDIPPGQLKRRGLSGQIVAVGEGSVFIQTNFGLVEVFIDTEVDDSLIGQRMAVKLAKEKDEDSGSDTGTTSGNVTDEGGSTDNVSGGLSVYRVATAEQFKLIPGKGSRQHKWGSVEETESGCTFVDDDGNSIPFECGTSGNGTGQMVGLATDNETDNGGTTFVGFENTSRIEARITARIARAEDEGDTKTLECLQRQIERYQEKQVERQIRAEEREARRAEKGKGGPPEDKGRGGGRGGGKK